MSAAAEATPTLAAPALGRWARPNEVPAIDFAPLATNSASAIDAVAREVDAACREIGFFTVINHPVPVAKIRRIFAESARFFSQPLEEKLKLHMRNSDTFRGYLPMDEGADARNARGRAVFGFQEHMGPARPSRASRPRPRCFRSRWSWPPTIPRCARASRCTVPIHGRTTCRGFARACSIITKRCGVLPR